MTAGTPEQAGDSFDSPDGRTYSEPVNAPEPGQAELRDLIRKRWNEVLTSACDTGVDYAMASLAAEAALGAIAAAKPAQDPRAGTTRHIPTGATWVSWGDDRQPPWKEIAEAVSRLTGGAVKVRPVESDPGRLSVAVYRDLPELEEM